MQARPQIDRADLVVAGGDFLRDVQVIGAVEDNAAVGRDGGNDETGRGHRRIFGRQLAGAIVEAGESDRRLPAQRSQQFGGRLRVVELDRRRGVGAEDRGQGRKLPHLRGADHPHVVDEEGDVTYYDIKRVKP